MAVPLIIYCQMQSCKNPGSVVALLQGNFEKVMNLRKFLRKKCAVVSRLEKYPPGFLPFIPIVCKVREKKNPFLSGIEELFR